MATVKKPIKKAQNGTVKYSDPTPVFEKLRKSQDSISKARLKLIDKKEQTQKNFKSKMAGLKKKMQTGGSIGSKVVKENPRQQKRLSRIRENNPERAERVEKRMVRRADRAMGARGAASRMKSGGSVKKK